MKTAASFFALTMIITACVTQNESSGGYDETLEQDGMTCVTDDDCTTRNCVDKKCVQCREDSDCGSLGTCNSQHMCAP